MAEVSTRRHAPGLLTAGTLAGATTGYLLSHLSSSPATYEASMIGATIGVLAAVVCDMICSRYRVAEMLPYGARVGCSKVGGSTFLFVTLPSILAVLSARRHWDSVDRLLSLEPHLLMWLLVTMLGATGGGVVAIVTAAAASGDDQPARRCLSFVVWAFALGLAATAAVRIGEYLLVGPPSVTVFAFLDQHTLGTLCVGVSAAAVSWPLSAIRRRSAVVSAATPTIAEAEPAVATDRSAPARQGDDDFPPPDPASRQRKAEILARMAAQR